MFSESSTGSVALDLYVAYVFNFLLEKEFVQYLLNFKRYRLQQPHFGKLLQSSTQKSKNYVRVSRSKEC